MKLWMPKRSRQCLKANLWTTKYLRRLYLTIVLCTYVVYIKKCALNKCTGLLCSIFFHFHISGIFQIHPTLLGFIKICCFKKIFKSKLEDFRRANHGCNFRVDDFKDWFPLMSFQFSYVLTLTASFSSYPDIWETLTGRALREGGVLHMRSVLRVTNSCWFSNCPKILQYAFKVWLYLVSNGQRCSLFCRMCGAFHYRCYRTSGNSFIVNAN